MSSPSITSPFPLLPALGTALLPVVAWRLAPPVVAATIAVTVIALLPGLAILRRRRQWRPGLLPAAIGLAAALTTAMGIREILWPCSLSCDNGAFYEELWGISLLLPASAGYLLFAILAWRDRRQQRPGPSTALVGWALVGASLYYLHLTWRLDMVCDHCFAIHGLVLWLPLCLIPARLPPLLAPLCAALAFCGLHLLYHPGIVDDYGLDVEAASHPQSTDPAIAAFLGGTQRPQAIIQQEQHLRDAAEAGRSLGASQAPYRLDIIYRFECAHCAADLDVLITGLQEAVATGSLRLRFIAATLGHDAASRDRAHLVYAAAARGRFLPALLALLGADRIRTIDGNRQRLSQLDDGAAIAALAEAHPDLWQAMAQADLARARISRGTTPRLHLYHYHEAVGRWIGPSDIPAVIATIRARLSD